jgi:hypothetical protein
LWFHRQLLQRLILGCGQFYDTLHRYPGVMTTPKVNKIQTRLSATHKRRDREGESPTKAWLILVCDSHTF